MPHVIGNQMILLVNFLFAYTKLYFCVLCQKVVNQKGRHMSAMYLTYKVIKPLAHRLEITTAHITKMCGASVRQIICKRPIIENQK